MVLKPNFIVLLRPTVLLSCVSACLQQYIVLLYYYYQCKIPALINTGENDGVSVIQVSE